MFANVAFLFTSEELSGNTQTYEMYAIRLPICTVATAVKEMFKYWDRFFGRYPNPHSQFYLITPVISSFLISM
jgi:hypothetical protein